MELKTGNAVPNFVGTDANGSQFDSKNYVGKQALVIYFYPKDETPGCTAEACSFRDNYQVFKDMGAEIIGISSDSVASHQKFIKKHQLPFILLSDFDKKIRKLFGVPSDLFGILPGRVTYIIDKEGVVRLVFNSMNGKSHITKAMAMLKTML